MDKAIIFLKDNFGQGLCYPVWIADDGEVMRQVARQESAKTIEPMSVKSGMAFDKRSSSVGQPQDKRVDTSALESRDACADVVLLGSSRETGEKIEYADLDDVIAKIVRKRDDLIQEKIQADEEIKRLELESQNLKNLNSISRRIITAQRDELAKLKLNAVRDQQKIEEQEKALQILRIRTIDARNVLDESTFLGGIGDCH